MFYHAHNGNIPIGNSRIDYISFGKGNKNLVMLPGLGDGLSTVKGMALVFSMMYRIYAKEFTVYVFSRKNHLQEGCSTREMAKDQAEAMSVLGIAKADVLGISQGGMIEFFVAIYHRFLVRWLIRALTSAGSN